MDDVMGDARQAGTVRYSHPGKWAALVLLIGLALLLPRLFADPGGSGKLAQAAGLVRAAPPFDPGAGRGLPAPEPLVFEPVGRERARMLNARMPMSSTPGVAAKPFLLSGNLESRERAIDCLAAAMWFEAGGDARGQRAVGQVILNRVRHPSFPPSICGVVFQGSERSTGCQFTFTCDGALARRPAERQLMAARVEARLLLDGSVDREVGLATHYHTDWVHPIWSAAMSKIARVDTHLFFRWAGRGGEARVMAQSYSGREAAIPVLAAMSPIHRLGLEAAGNAPDGADGLALALPPPPLEALPIAAPAPPANVFEMPVQPGGTGGAQAMAALGVCGDREFCKVIGRPQASGANGPVVLLFVRDRRTGVERVFWDCDAFSRANAAQCLSTANRFWIGFTGNLETGSVRRNAPSGKAS